MTGIIHGASEYVQQATVLNCASVTIREIKEHLRILSLQIAHLPDPNVPKIIGYRLTHSGYSDQIFDCIRLRHLRATFHDCVWSQTFRYFNEKIKTHVSSKDV